MKIKQLSIFSAVDLCWWLFFCYFSASLNRNAFSLEFYRQSLLPTFQLFTLNCFIIVVTVPLKLMFLLCFKSAAVETLLEIQLEKFSTSNLSEDLCTIGSTVAQNEGLVTKLKTWIMINIINNGFFLLHNSSSLKCRVIGLFVVLRSPSGEWLSLTDGFELCNQSGHCHSINRQSKKVVETERWIDKGWGSLVKLSSV